MRVLIDSSVWADFLNGHPSRESDALAELLAGEHDPCTCGIVAAEVFQGLRRPRDRQAIETLFRKLTFLEPPAIDLYLRAAEIFRLLRGRGVTVRSTIDCIIAAMAEANGCYLLARDRDLHAIVDSGLVRAGLWSLQPPR